MVDKNTFKLIKTAMVDSFARGDIKLLTANKDDSFTEIKHEDAICNTCKKNIGNVLNSFSYFIIQSKDMIGIDEKCFCSRKCWYSYLENEVMILKKKELL